MPSTSAVSPYSAADMEVVRKVAAALGLAQLSPGFTPEDAKARHAKAASIPIPRIRPCGLMEKVIRRLKVRVPSGSKNFFGYFADKPV